MNRSEAEVLLAAILRPINEGTAPGARPVYTFDQFVERAYLPHCRRTWKKSTETTSVPVIMNHLVAVFRDRLLRTVNRTEMQDLLERKALTLSRSVVAHLRWHLNGIFKLAVSDGLIDHNPAAQLRIPKNCKPGRAVRRLTEDGVNYYLRVLALRERLMARLAIFEGLRPGEILALRWGAFEQQFVWVRERVYKGKFDTPKNGKPREGGVSDGTLADLRAWRGVAGSPAADAFVFPSENSASPLDMGNLWDRSFAPALKRVGLEWATFQVLRRTNATLSEKAKVSAKVSADQRGHGLGVSMGVYVESDRQQKRQGIRKLESMVTRKRQRKLLE
ncbi:MAG TPA: tyrosine-type recombinase/integrase [Candidatus Nitrosotalea sp.]|nr:tyrosine-type recombinase/integrase [Candidatus Nitrosotalea sp.]